MELKEFYELQDKLDKMIVEKSFEFFGGDHNHIEFLSDRILALFTEVGEFANATRCFKYWSKRPQESKERLLDEYVDIYFFWLSIGNTMKFTPLEVEAAYRKKYRENIRRQKEGY